MKHKIFIILSLIIITGGLIYLQMNREIKIAFLGDSITEFGWLDDNGYVRQTANKLWQEGKNIKVIPAGIRGETTSDMLNRMDNDIIKENPDVMFFMGGINDIWQRKTENYEQNVKNIVEKAKKHNIKVILINLTIFEEDLNSDFNKDIEKCNQFLSDYAKENKIQLIDVHSDLINELKKHDKKKDHILTVDGVHMNDLGNTILADKIVSEYLKK